MIIYPAIDIRGGRAVQLVQGRPESEVVYDSPADRARQWVRDGATAIHMVNLDGTLAYGSRSTVGHGAALSLNLQRVREVRACVDVSLQFAGGLRTERDLRAAEQLGVDKIVIGTAALTDPSLVAWALERWGADRLAIALETSNGVLVTHGWQVQTTIKAEDIGKSFYRSGVRRVLYTNVDREGLLAGPDIAGAVALHETTGLRVTVSGGVGGLDDIRALAKAPAEAIEGVVIGQAIYTGALSLADAIAVAAA